LTVARRLLGRAEFRIVVVAVAAVSLMTITDAFIFLTFRRGSGIDQRLFPLLFVGSAVVYMAAAIPMGRLADRVGPTRVFLGGQVALAAVYALLLMSDLGGVGLVALLVGLGLFYAATDGVLAALASRVVPVDSGRGPAGRGAHGRRAPGCRLHSPPAEGPLGSRLTSIVLDETADARATELHCDRVDVAGGRGVCLFYDTTRERRSAIVFDPVDFRKVREVPIEGLPSRVRVSPDGRLAASTSFVAGDSYNVDSFSTRTLFLDLERGEVITDLERFEIRRDGREFHPIDMTMTTCSMGFRTTGSTAPASTSGP